jgi:hypothetical protein
MSEKNHRREKKLQKRSERKCSKTMYEKSGLWPV